MTLESILREKYGTNYAIGKVYKMDKSNVRDLLKSNNPMLETVQRLCINGITCTIKNGRSVWNDETN